ncbi:MAG TPA: type III pantothenate kinase [Salinivirgaceae bacterium]|nr:type III pantothenate kinase [Salinivirgaceae bacterium]
MQLVIDIGNTNVKVGYFHEMCLVDKKIFSSGFEGWENLLTSEVASAIVGGSGVIPIELLQISQAHGIPIHRFTPASKIPLTNAYETPETLGSDRIAGAVGACEIFKDQPILVIDSGTAITYDLIVNKTFLGGNISPGMTLRFKALNQFTQRLPLVSPPEDIELYGKNTYEAIAYGVINGLVYEINQTIETFNQKYNNLKIIITGGDALYFVNKIKKTIFVEPNLVLIGLNRILKENV